MAPGAPSKLKQLLNALSKPWTMHFGALGNQRKASAVGFSGLGAAASDEISVRNTSKAEAAPKCAFQALKLDLGLPGTKAFAA